MYLLAQGQYQGTNFTNYDSRGGGNYQATFQVKNVSSDTGPRNRPDDTNQSLALVTQRLPIDSAATAPTDINFIRVWTPRTALTQAGRVLQSRVDSVSISTQYIDGLGRPVQTVNWQASPQKRDLVQPQAYDGLGRESRQYLPYPDSIGGRGGYRYQALTQQQQFYRTLGVVGPPVPNDPTRGVARTGVAYTETQFEASPLNRILAHGNAGEAWQLAIPGSAAVDHGVHRLERTNAALLDSVPRLQPSYDRTNAGPGYQGYYADGELWGTQVTDEQGHQTIEWKCVITGRSKLLRR